jgi:putative MATE family efflux protein
MEHQQTRQLGEESIGKLLLKFSLPATIGTFVNSLYNVVDRIFIGQGVGPDGLAAAMIAFPIMMMVMAVGMLIGFGSNTLISIKLGEKNKKGAEQILGQALFLFVIFSVLFTVFGLMFLTPLLKLFGASEAVLPLAKDYTSIILIGVLFHLISFGVNNFIRGEGNPRVAMITLIIGAGVNIILDPIFIFGLQMGMKGAALATIIAQALAAAWIIYYYMSNASVLKVRRRFIAIDYKLAKRVIVVGSPPFAMNFANVFIFAFVNNALKTHGGDTAIAVMGVIFTIYTINFMPIIGISQGAQPIIGYNHGANNFDRVKKTLLMAIKIVTLFGIVATALVMLFPKFTFLPFSRGNSDLIPLGMHAIRIIMIMFPFVGFMVLSSNYFQATARPQISLFLSMLRQIIVLIPCVLILPRFWGLDGIWFSFPISAFVAVLTSSLFFLREILKLNKLIKHDANDC